MICAQLDFIKHYKPVELLIVQCKHLGKSDTKLTFLSREYRPVATHRLKILALKAHTHRLIFRGFVVESTVESADSIPESADSTTNFVIVGRLPVLNMFNISTPIKSADCSQPTIAVGRLQIGPVGMGL